MMKSRVPCDGCCGRGVVPHQKRQINGEVDPFDHQDEEICSKCGGDGKMPAPPPPDETPVTQPMIPLSFLNEGVVTWYRAFIQAGYL